MVSAVGDEPDEVIGQRPGESRRMRLPARLPAAPQVPAVAVRVGDCQKIWWDRPLVVVLELSVDVMPGWTLCACGCSVSQELPHALAVGLEHPPVARLRPWRLREPPHGVHRVLDADSADGDPLCGARDLGGVPPVEVLREVEPEFIAQHDEQLELVEAARRAPAVPRAPDVDHEASAVLQDALDLGREGPEPLGVPIGIDVAVVLRPQQAERRARHHEVHRPVGHAAHRPAAIGLDDPAEPRLVHDARGWGRFHDRLFRCSRAGASTRFLVKLGVSRLPGRPASFVPLPAPGSRGGERHRGFRRS